MAPELRRDSAALLNGHQATPPSLASVPSTPNHDITPTSSSSSCTNNRLEASSSLNSSPPEPAKLVKELNQFITCHLCKGYLIDATTIIECLHSYCRSCIIKHLDKDTTESRLCPKCNCQIHKTRPKQNIRSDPTLQDIVYKLVPKLYKNEMSWRKNFYSRHPDKVAGLSNEEKGEIHGERMIISPDDNIQLTIEYFPEVPSPFKLLPFKKDENQMLPDTMNQRRYLLCLAGMRVLQLIKFIRYKYDLDAKIQVNFFYRTELLKEDLTLMDLAYTYSASPDMPISLYYLIIEPNKDKSDYLCLVSNSKLPMARLHRQQKRRKVMKNILEPSNCNAQLNNSNSPCNNTRPLVSSSQRLFDDVPTLSLGANTNAPQIAQNASASTSVPKENMLVKSQLGTGEKRKISDDGSTESQSVEAKKPKLAAKENLVQSKTTNAQIQNEITFSEDDDSSTDVSENSQISYQIDLICKNESEANFGDVENPRSVTNIATSTTTSIEPAATTSNHIINPDTQMIKPSTSSATASKLPPTDPPVLTNLTNSSDQGGHSSSNGVQVASKPTEVLQKVEVKTTTNLMTSLGNTVTVASLQQSTASNGSLETTVKNVPSAEKNVLIAKEQNVQIITPTVISNNTTFLLQSPKCDSTATAPLKSSFLDTRKDVVFAHPAAVNKPPSNGASAQENPVTNGHAKTTENSAAPAVNTLKPLMATNGKNKFCFPQFTHRPEFIAKALNMLHTNIGKSIPPSSINIEPSTNAPNNSLTN